MCNVRPDITRLSAVIRMNSYVINVTQLVKIVMNSIRNLLARNVRLASN